MILRLPEHTDPFSCARTFSFDKAETRFAWTGCFCIFCQPYWLLALLAINLHFFGIVFLNVWIDLVIPNMENTTTPNDLPLWLIAPQTPKPQADGVVMVRYPRNEPAKSASVDVANRFPPITRYESHQPTPDFNFKPKPGFTTTQPPKSVLPVMPDPTPKKRKLTCPGYDDWVNGLKFFNKESDNLYTIAGTRDAIKKFAECWQ